MSPQTACSHPWESLASYPALQCEQQCCAPRPLPDLGEGEVSRGRWFCFGRSLLLWGVCWNRAWKADLKWHHCWDSIPLGLPLNSICREGPLLPGSAGLGRRVPSRRLAPVLSVLHWVPVETSVGDCLFLQLEMRWKGSMSVEPSLTSRKHKHLLALVRFPFSPLPWAGPQTWPGSEQHL